MNQIAFLVILFLSFIFIFAIFPRLTHHFVTKLFTYHDYKNEKYKKHPVLYRTKKALKVYVWMSLGLSIIFTTIFGINHVEEIAGMSLVSIFVVSSFFLIFSMRITVLMNKTNAVCMMNQTACNILKDFNKEYNGWKELKEYMKSFLFSIILFGIILTGTLFMFNELISYNLLTVFGEFSGTTGRECFTIAGYALLIIITMGLLSFFGELALHLIGVRNECKEKETT